MLPLDSPRWSTLRHAYGPADDIPALLRQLDGDPWDALWSALAHQGDVNTASFAAVPHVVGFIAAHPDRAHFQHYLLPTWIEVCRVQAGVAVPDDLREACEAALAQLPALAGAAVPTWPPDFLNVLLAAMAVGRGQPVMAEALLELTPAVAGDFLTWFAER